MIFFHFISFIDVKSLTHEGIDPHQYNHSFFNKQSHHPSVSPTGRNIPLIHKNLERQSVVFRVKKTDFTYCNKLNVKQCLIYRLSNYRKCRIKRAGPNMSKHFKTQNSTKTKNTQNSKLPRCANHNITQLSVKENTSSTWLSHPSLPRIITKNEYDSFTSLVSDVSRLFESANITLVMSGGTLLGSYMFHDMIPWDDDMDLCIPYRDVPKVKRLFRNETLRQTLQICSWGPLSISDEYDYKTLSRFPNNSPNELYYRVRSNDADTLSEHFFKLFYTHSQRVKTQTWRWPFIDIAIYDEDGAQVKFIEQCLMFPWNVFYPLIRRPLGPNMLLAPRDTRVVLQEQFHHFQCVSTAWSHRLEVGACRPINIQCEKLWNHYPQVWSKPTNHGVLEKLMLGNKTLNIFEYKNNEYISNRPYDF